MTSNNSSTKTTTKTQRQAQSKGQLLLHSCRSYWWLAVICSVVYGFAGPVFTLLKLDSVTRPSWANYQAAFSEEILLERQLKNIADWMHVEGFMMLYIAAVVMAAIIGCVMFFYLQQKRQIYFYHSQPISRTRLFWNQYVTGLIINVVPLVMMLVISCLLVMAYHLGAALSLSAVLLHLAHILLFLFASYSIALLASQLAGTLLTQMALNAVLHVCVPVAALLVNYLSQLFLATYGGSTDIVTNSLKFSPLCALYQYLDETPNYLEALVMQTTPMAGSMIAVLLVMGITLTALSWLLYQKRPSEATGKALIYPVSEPLVKAYLMFVISLTAGIIFMLSDSKAFFYFAVIAFAILTHMTCEVILQHDFKAMGRKLPQCAVILVLILGVIFLFRFDILGYDAYLPNPDQVAQVKLDVSDAESRYYNPTYDFYGEDIYSEDEAVKAGVYQLLKPVVEQKQYLGSDFTTNRTNAYRASDERTTQVIVRYELKNGRNVERRYRAVPRSAMEEPYAALYNQQAYRKALYQNVLQLRAEQIASLNVDENSVIDITDDPSAIADATASQQVKQLLEAYQQDLLERDFATITTSVQHNLAFDLKQSYRMYHSYWHIQMPVYADDERTMAVLAQWNLPDSNRFADYSEAFVFRCPSGSEQELRTVMNDLLYEKADAGVTGLQNAETTVKDKTANGELDLNNLPDGVQLTGHITEKEAVKQFIRQTGILNTSGMFSQYDDCHVVLLKIDGNEYMNWSQQLLYANTLPEQYQ